MKKLMALSIFDEDTVVPLKQVWLRCGLFPAGVAVLLSLAACANQSSVSQPAEPLSVTNAPNAGLSAPR